MRWFSASRVSWITDGDRTVTRSKDDWISTSVTKAVRDRWFCCNIIVVRRCNNEINNSCQHYLSYYFNDIPIEYHMPLIIATFTVARRCLQCMVTHCCLVTMRGPQIWLIEPKSAKSGSNDEQQNDSIFTDCFLLCLLILKFLSLHLYSCISRSRV